MSEPFDAEKMARTMAEVMELTLRPEWVPGVVANLKTTATLAALVQSFPLPDETEPAPVFAA